MGDRPGLGHRMRTAALTRYIVTIYLHGYMPTATPETTPTGRVILGMLSLGKSHRLRHQAVRRQDRPATSGRRATGRSIRSSRRLEDAGSGPRAHDEPTGGRARTVYELTEAGRAALDSWLCSTEVPLYELRDEGMLKLFFSDALPGAADREHPRECVSATSGSSRSSAIESHASQGPLGPRTDARARDRVHRVVHRLVRAGGAPARGRPGIWSSPDADADSLISFTRTDAAS